jgi:glyoxylase-like metal-dependent hydrolase (beta-lactamase superfamily II)
MLVESIAAPFYGTNCWILATGKNEECVIVDPGIAIPDLTNEIYEIVDKYKLKPVATLLTHGHLDHTFSVVPMATSVENSGAANKYITYIHAGDRELLTYPERALSAESAALLSMLASETGREVFHEPGNVKEVKSNEVLAIAGLSIKIVHAPGHTRGSVIFMVEDKIAVTGDVLFAGSIGRTDLPTGSMTDMTKTLQEKIITLPDEIRVLPGHGPETTIARERKSNPYLKNLTVGVR